MEAKEEAVFTFGIRIFKSSVLAELVYCAATRELDVMFVSTGDTYRYFDVPSEVVSLLWGAAFASNVSVGEVFAAQVRNIYRYEKISV